MWRIQVYVFDHPPLTMFWGSDAMNELLVLWPEA